MRFTYYCILLAHSCVFASASHPFNEVFPTLAKWYVDNIEAFSHPLLDDLFGEVLRICTQDYMNDFGFVEGIEERGVLLVEPRGVEGHVGDDGVNANGAVRSWLLWLWL